MAQGCIYYAASVYLLEIKWKDKQSFGKCQCAALKIVQAEGDHQSRVGLNADAFTAYCDLHTLLSAPVLFIFFFRKSESMRFSGAKKTKTDIKRRLTKERSCECEMRTGSGETVCTLKKAASGPFFS